MAVNNNSLSITKLFHFPRELIYEVWTQPKHAEQWGPSGMKIQLDYSDVREGGTYHITMIGGERGVYVNSGAYKEIIPNKKLVFTHGWEGPDRVDTEVTIELKDKDDGTELNLTQVGFENKAAAISHEEGWSSALDNLDKYLKQLKSSESFQSELA